MDSVAEIDVGATRLAEENFIARCSADEAVARWLSRVIGLGLDDPAADAFVHQRATDQVASDVDDRAVVESLVESFARR